AEVFHAHRLGDAIARLYAWHADILPDGSARTRAAATARSVAVVVDRLRDPDRIATALAPAVEFVDHRPIGLGSGRGAAVFRRWVRARLELRDDLPVRGDDILGTRPDGFLARWANVGTDRFGGAYEQHFLALWVCGPDGLLTRLEYFDPDRDDDAIARFDELTAAASPAARRCVAAVRPNAATANAAAIDAVIAAREQDALAQLTRLAIAEGYEVVDHINGVTYDLRGSLATWDALMRVPDLTSRHDSLATLGDSLALFRHTVWASGVARGNFDIGAYEIERIFVVETDSTGRRSRAEAFHAHRLGDAIARLYAWHADLLPDGPARVRAAATAR